jgi:hypothetical protein
MANSVNRGRRKFLVDTATTIPHRARARRRFGLGSYRAQGRLNSHARSRHSLLTRAKRPQVSHDRLRISACHPKTRHRGAKRPSASRD